MKEFLQLMRRFVSPYKRYIGWAIVLNVLSAIFKRIFIHIVDSYSQYPLQNGGEYQSVRVHGVGERRHQGSGGE